MIAQDNPGTAPVNTQTQLPLRLNTTNPSESQVIVSMYTLQSYFRAYQNEYSPRVYSQLPSSFPIALNANNGYFPEIQAVYPNMNLTLSLMMPTVPYIFILNTGILFRANAQLSISVVTASGTVSLSNYSIVFDYQCTANINYGLIQGNCLKPKLVSLVQINQAMPISNFNLQRFTFDMIYALFRAGYISFFFPNIPLNYPSHTKFTINNVVYNAQGGYIGIQYFATYPSNS